MYPIMAESDRIPEAVRCIDKRIESIEMDLNSLDYSEDINGDLIYTPGGYSEERRMFEYELNHLQTIRKILTGNIPTIIHDY